MLHIEVAVIVHVRHFDRVRERDAARQRDEPVDSALIRCKSRQRTGSRCYPRSGGKLMATARSAARTASSEGALRADRSAVRPLSAQCAVRTAAVRCALRSFSVRTALTHCARFHRTAVDFHTALRSISPHCVRFPPQCASAVRSIQTAQVPRSAPRPVTEPRPVAWKPLPMWEEQNPNLLHVKKRK